MTIPLFEQQVTVFAGNRRTTPVEQLPLGAMLARMQDGTYQPHVEALQAYKAAWGKAAYDTEKGKSQAFTPCCAMTTRKKEAKWPDKLISTTGLVYFDIDDVDDPEAVKAQLARDPRVCFTFLSPSARGVKVGVAAEGITGPDDYKTVWAALLASFQQSYPAIVFKVDDHVKFLNALCYVSYDPQLYVNPEATPFVMPPAAPTRPRKARPLPPPGTDASDEARAQEALRHIPADDYEIWLAVGMALHSTGWPMARSLWDTWSATSDKYEEKTQDSKWRGFIEEGGRTIATMFDLAKTYGYRPPKKEKATYKAPVYPAAVPQMWSAAPAGDPPAGTGTPEEAPGTPAPAHRPPVNPDDLLTDNLNARVLVRDHGQDFRHCSAWDSWLAWSVKHWQRDTAGAVMQFAKKTIKGMAKQITSLEDTESKLLLKHITSSLSTARLKAMLVQAQDEPTIPVEPGQLDNHPWLLNCKNGTLNLENGELLKHNREHLLTKCLAVNYKKDAECPTWETFLWHIMGGTPPDQDESDMTEADLERRQAADDRAGRLIDFLQRAIGYALTGVIREHVLIILWGNGRNGKSTFLGTLLSVLGPYAMKAPSELLMVGTHDRHPTERAELFKKRFVAAIETEQGRRMAEVFVKEATGGDPITARRMREDLWTFLPTHKLFLATNHKPIIRGKDNAIWERLKPVEFGVTIEKPDTKLAEKLQGEAEGILAWAVRGCMTWQKDGLGEPAAVTQGADDWRAAMDTLGAFIAAKGLTGPNYNIQSSVLYEAYTTWCAETKKLPATHQKWGADMIEHGFARYTNNGTWYRGIALKPVVP